MPPGQTSRALIRFGNAEGDPTLFARENGMWAAIGSRPDDDGASTALATPGCQRYRLTFHQKPSAGHPAGVPGAFVFARYRFRGNRFPELFYRLSHCFYPA